MSLGDASVDLRAPRERVWRDVLVRFPALPVSAVFMAGVGVHRVTPVLPLLWLGVVYLGSLFFQCGNEVLLDLHRGEDIYCGFSVGISQLPPFGPPEVALQQADQNMYKAKNRIR